MSEELIKIENLHLSYEVREISQNASFFRHLFRSSYVFHPVLRDLNWTISEPSGITSLLGRNGSGKTTLIKLLTGILQPSSGNIEVIGCRPAERKSHFLKQIGVVFGQKRILWPDLSLYENLMMTGVLYGLPSDQIKNRVQHLADQFRLSALLERSQKSLSLGESMKAELINALLPNPRLLFLDEPTVGLDIESQRAVRSMLLSYVKEQSCHIILTSHNLKDIVELSSAVFLLEDGKIEELNRDPSQDKSFADYLENRLISRETVA